jgi:hypothetical protein
MSPYLPVMAQLMITFRLAMASPVVQNFPPRLI